MSGLDEQDMIRCAWCDSGFGFVYRDFRTGIDVHLHGRKIYLSTTSNTPRSSIMFMIPVGESPSTIFRNNTGKWKQVITDSRISEWYCKSCKKIINTNFGVKTFRQVYVFVGHYRYDDMIYVGTKELFDKLEDWPRV